MAPPIVSPVRVDVLVPPEMADQLDEIAASNGVKRAVVVRALLSRALAAPAARPGPLDLGLDRHRTKVVDR